MVKSINLHHVDGPVNVGMASRRLSEVPMRAEWGTALRNAKVRSSLKGRRLSMMQILYGIL